ncbi:MAG: hypothetical protein HYZ73_04150 [Elusimicrobia bacterium]|nr:hypothetical protein [Elusimicrobiota bacterium]
MAAFATLLALLETLLCSGACAPCAQRVSTEAAQAHCAIAPASLYG